MIKLEVWSILHFFQSSLFKCQCQHCLPNSNLLRRILFNVIKVQMLYFHTSQAGKVSRSWKPTYRNYAYQISCHQHKSKQSSLQTTRYIVFPKYIAVPQQTDPPTARIPWKYSEYNHQRLSMTKLMLSLITPMHKVDQLITFCIVPFGKAYTPSRTL